MKKTFLLSLIVLCFSCFTGFGQSRSTLQLRLVGTDPRATRMPLKAPPAASYYFKRYSQSPVFKDDRAGLRSWFRDVYPGIDLLAYGDKYNIEYVFVVHEGADPSLIRLAFQGNPRYRRGHGESITFYLGNAEVVQSSPTVFLQQGSSEKKRITARYRIDRKNELSLITNYDPTQKLNGTIFNIVPAGGQPGGPNYTFYMSKYETTCDQFLSFLNDAEKNSNSPRGKHLVFDPLGNVWFNLKKEKGKHEVFNINMSHLVYDRVRPVGERYEHWTDEDGETPFMDHPITGVSWFGAVKYCNWLTLHSGRGTAEQCYTEGTNAVDWAPVTATNWANGTFGDAERALWLKHKGMRLPMLNCDVPVVTTNLYNEFYKAAAWSLTTNRLYGFGRNTCSPIDANSRATQSERPGYQTLPVGYFDGETYLADTRTAPNENLYGIADLSGNVAEWVNDPARTGSLGARVVCGGGWSMNLRPLSESDAARPTETDIAGGFRSVTTYLPPETLYIHIFYSFYMEPIPAPTEEKPEPEIPSGQRPLVETAEGEQEGRPGGIDITPETRTEVMGITYAELPSGIIEQPVSGGGGGGGAAGNIPSINPPSILVTNQLTIQSSPNSVSIQVLTPDINGDTDQATPFPRYYLSTTPVHLIAPPTDGTGLTFLEWRMDGLFYSSSRDINNISMASPHTMEAIYTTPALAVELGYSDNASGVPWAMTNYAGPGDLRWLIARPIGGSGTYTGYAYEYKFEIHSNEFANIWWAATNASFAVPTNQVKFYKSVRFRVALTDSLGATALSNEALLVIDPWEFHNPPDPETRTRP